MKQGGVKEHTRLGVVTIMQDYRYLGRGKNLALRTELFSTYMEPLSRVSRGKSRETDTGKTDYRHRARTGCVYRLPRYIGEISYARTVSPL